MIKWRQRIGKEGCEKILALTIQAGIVSGVIRERQMKQVVVDTTVQEKNIAFPTDSALYVKALEKLVFLAKDLGIHLRQTYKRTAKVLALRVSRYAHANQFKRMRKPLRTLKCLIGRVFREIQRKANLKDLERKNLSSLLALVQRLLAQNKKTKDKVYSLHAPETECIGKGKAHKKYEFGNKVAFVIPLKRAFIVGAQSFQGNPYDGHTLESSLEQVHSLTGIKVEQAFVDQGYRGHTARDSEVFLSRQKRGVTKTIKRHLKRRQSIEPVIGHMKQDGKLGRNYLRGITGNEINAILSGAGFNIRTILNKINLILEDLSRRLLSTHHSFEKLYHGQNLNLIFSG